MRLMKLQCMSHTPLMGYVDPQESVEQAARHAIATLREDLERFSPDVIFLFAPDHYNGFFYDVMPSFCIGIAATSIGDYSTRAGRLNVPKDIAQACAEAVVEAGVDSAVSYRMQVDHGFAQPIELLTGSLDRIPVVPIFVNAAAAPLPSFKRARLLGEAVGRFAATLDKRVLFMGSGGLSHNPPMPTMGTATPDVAERLISGRNPTPQARAEREERTKNAARELVAGTSTLRLLNPEWDKAFIQTLTSRDLESLDRISSKEVTELGGASANEVKTWVAANAAMAAATDGRYVVRSDYYQAIPEWIAGFATLQGDMP